MTDTVHTPYPHWGEEVRLAAEGAPSLSLQLLAPPGPPQGCLLIVHGMHEYIGRYGVIARHFAERFFVAGVDLRAHGLTNPVLAAADRAVTLGEASCDVGDAFLEQAPLGNLAPMRADLKRALDAAVARCPRGGDGGEAPLFILSHSLGALVAASFLLEERGKGGSADRVQGIVLAGPAFSVPRVPGRWGGLANGPISLSFFSEEHCFHKGPKSWPLFLLSQTVAMPVSLLLNGLFEILSWPGVRNIVSPRTPDWVPDFLSDDPAERARHRADGYIIRRSILRYVKGIEREIVRFRRQMAAFDFPYLLIYAEHDPITPAWGNRDFLNATRDKHPDNAIVHWPDQNHHEQLFSSPPFREALLRYIDHWLDSRLQARC
jgi:alpha-beta hydrolase superfamily lysophospholipase